MCDFLYSHSVVCGRHINVAFYRWKGRLRMVNDGCDLTGRETRVGGLALQTLFTVFLFTAYLADK